MKEDKAQELTGQIHKNKYEVIYMLIGLIQYFCNAYVL